MKRLLALFLAVAVVALGDTDERRPPMGLLKFATFNHGDARDLAPLAQTPTANGNAAFASGYATFDGTDDYITWPDNAALEFTDGAGTDKPFSVSLWVNLAVASNVNRVGISKFNATGSQREWIFLVTSNFTTGSAMKGPVLYLSNPGATLLIARGETVNNMTTSTWIHLVATYSGNESTTGINIYRDGVDVDDGNTTVGVYAGMTGGTAPLSIGADAGAGQDLNGYLDDVRVYDRVLTAAEVLALKAAGRN